MLESTLHMKYSSFSIIVSFVCLSWVGLALVPLLPLKLNPSHSLNGFTVGYSMSGASSRVVEMEVTSKLEGVLARIEGVKNINSKSGNGWGYIQVDLDRHADVDVARFEASSAVRQVWSQLPSGVSYPTLQLNKPSDDASRPFLTYSINAPTTPALLQTYVEGRIKPQLAAIAGIYQIELNGATPMEWQLTYDHRQLQQHGLTVTDLTQAIERHYHKEFLGIHQLAEGQWLRVALTPSTKSLSTFEPAKIVVANRDGKLISLDQLVSVAHTEEEPCSYYRINGLNSIYLSITAEKGANQLTLGRQVEAVMQQVRSALPAEYEVVTQYDATKYIRTELDKIYLRTGLTILILLLFVWTVTRRWRYLLLISISLTINIAVAVIFYYAAGLELQLYSLAGITISLNLVIDNIIVMAHHYMHRHNLRAFMAVLAATLTTIGALVIIFFLDDRIRLNLQDFAAVVIINLVVSLAIALFLVPALMERLRLVAQKSRRPYRLSVYLSRFYQRQINFFHRWRWVVFTLLILAFGLPVFMLPEKLEGSDRWSKLYNSTLGSNTYKEHIKPIADVALGGTLRLFVQKVYDGSYFGRNEEVVLSVNANLPNGSTLQQMNHLVQQMEQYLTQFGQVRQFHTTIHSAQRASISIYFTREHQHSGFPYRLKGLLTARALQLGGGSWSIYGLDDQGFSNDVREGTGSYRVKMYGYNYDELYAHAERLKAKFLEQRRIKEVLINSEFSWWKDDYQEFFLQLKSEQMAKDSIAGLDLYSSVQPVLEKDMIAGSVIGPDGTEQIKLSSLQQQEYDVWSMNQTPYMTTANRRFKLADLAKIDKGQMPPTIAKEDQQYRLCLQYEYIGSYEMGNRVLNRTLEEFCKTLPVGYTAEAEGNTWSWGDKDRSQYLALLIVIGIIFLTASVLFNSLRQPFAIIFVIPLSYIGVFLTFYLFQLNFDQGGFASLVLLCGITVNASIYLLNEYNQILKRYPRLTAVQAFVKAWNAKVGPIMLTVLSTVLGFIPFMIGTEKEAFWFPLAAGTIGGLVFSVLVIYLCLPIFCLRWKR